jgi:hypothetical protein
VGAEFFHLGARDSKLSVHGGPAHAPDAVVAMSDDTLYGLLAGQTTPAVTVRRATVEGDPEIALGALESLHGVLAQRGLEDRGHR